MPKSLDDILNAATLPEQKVGICLRADLQTKWEDAQAALDAIDEAITADTAGDGESRATTTQGTARRRRDAAKAVQAVEVEMADETIEFTIRALPFAEYNALIVKNPARDGSLTDRAFGFNTDTLLPALLKACIVDPAITDQQWATLQEKLTDRQWDRFTGAALEVNRAKDGSVPFSQRASELTRG